MRPKTPRERGQEWMFHRCGCSAFITNLAYLIIDQNSGWIRRAGLLFVLCAWKFQVGRWETNAFGQGLTLCSGSTLLAILIVSTQTSPFQYLMFSSLFSLIIQLTVIFPWTGGAAQEVLAVTWEEFTAQRRASLSEKRCWICDVYTVILWAERWNCRRTWARFRLMTSEGTDVGATPGCCWVECVGENLSQNYVAILFPWIFKKPIWKWVLCFYMYSKQILYNCTSSHLFAQSAEWKSERWSKSLSKDSGCYLRR